jgi:hypothetical protein
MGKGAREKWLGVLLAALAMLATGCGSWRDRIGSYDPLPDPGAGAPAELAAANALVEQAVRAADRYAEFPETRYSTRHTPDLFKEARVLYGASLDTFPLVLDRWLRAQRGKVLSVKHLKGDGGREPSLLIKLRVRVPEEVICWIEVSRRGTASAHRAPGDAGVGGRGANGNPPGG